MASYAALLSAMLTINQIKKHPLPPISLDPKQVESLTQNLTFLLNFLERCSSSSEEEEEDEDLESRIAAAAYATEDVIESHIVDRIHSGSDISSADLYQALGRVIQDMDLIKKEVNIKDKMGAQCHNRLPRKSLVKPASTQQSSTEFEFDDVLIKDVLDKLVVHESYLQVIPIVGMGGIGKTSLALNIYKDPLIIHHFDILVWVTISQKYSVKQILSQVLSEGNNGSEDELGESGNNGSEDDLGERVHKKLWDRRYLIVMDDIWSIDAWDQVKSFFPDNNNGSRVMITTRLSKLASDLSGSQVVRMNFLNEDQSRTLLCKTVFGNEGCPIELQYIVEEITRNCKGLPLSIVVIGGLLKNSNITHTYWKCILDGLSSFINLDKDEYCLRLLRIS